MGIFDYFSKKMLLFSKTFTCFNKQAKLMLLFWKEDSVTKRIFMKNYLIYLWYAPKRHRNHKNYRKSQFGFLKMVEIKAKSDERQRKTWWIFEKLCILSPLLIWRLYCLNSWKFFTFHRAMQYIYIYILHRCEPTTF